MKNTCREIGLPGDLPCCERGADSETCTAKDAVDVIDCHSSSRIRERAGSLQDATHGEWVNGHLRSNDARRRLENVESALTAAEDAYEQAKQASRDAAAAVKEAKKAMRGS